MQLAQVVEIICDRGSAAADRWSVGSGYLVRSGVALTAAHVVAGAMTINVRFAGTTELVAEVALTCAPQADLAVLTVTESPTVRPSPYGRVARDVPGRVSGCRAVGFPRFKEVVRDGRRLRDSAQVDGYLPTAEGMVSRLLTFRTDVYPRPLTGGMASESAWAGMSGAAVFTGDTLVGVVSEHHLAEGDASLTVTPLDALRDGQYGRFWALLGTDPDKLAVVTSDADAGRRPSVAVVGAALAVPERLTDFTGRSAELNLLAGWLAGPPRRAIVLWGQPGVGKSQLAVEVAHSVASAYPDGALAIDLQGYSAERVSAEQAADRLVGVLLAGEEAPSDPAARLAVCRHALRTGKYLLILDNAGSEAQVSGLVPSGGTSAVILTSRSPLAGLDADLVKVELLVPASAVALLRAIVGDARGSDAEYAELAALCGQLPLALRIAGALLRARPHWTVAELNRRLADETRRLGLLERNDKSVRAVFDSAVAALDGAGRRMYALLGAVRAIRLAPWMAAALSDVDGQDAEEEVEQLVEAQLLLPAGRDTTGGPRYRFHDLVRLHARKTLAALIPPTERTVAEERVLSGYLALALRYTARHPIAANYDLARQVELPWFPSERLPVPTDAMEWLVDERRDLVAEVEHAHEAGQWRFAWGIADILDPLFVLTAHGTDSRRVKDLALASARAAGDADVELDVRFSFNGLLLNEGHYDEAIAALRDLRGRYRERGKIHRSGYMDLLLGVVQRDASRLNEAEGSLRRAIDTFGEADPTGPPAGILASAQQNLAVVLRERGQLREADALLARCVPVFEAHGDSIALGRSLHTRGMLYVAIGAFDAARGMLLRACQLCRGVGDRRWTGITLLGLARLAAREREWELAATRLAECEELFDAIADALGRAQVLRSRAALLRRSGRLTEAGEITEEALRAMAGAGDRRSSARTYYSASLLALVEARWSDAMAALDRAAELFRADDLPWPVRVRLTRLRAETQDESTRRYTGIELAAVHAELDAYERVAGAGFSPLWITAARQRFRVDR